MKKYLAQSLDFLLFSNLFIALCAVAQAGVTYLLVDAQPDKHILGILFCATIAMYNFSILLSKPKHPENSTFRRVRWIFENYQITIGITLIAVLSIIPLALLLSATSKILLFFLAFISLAYNLPLFTVNDEKFGLRNIPGIKLFLIALTWSLSVVLLPILELEASQALTISTKDTILLIAKQFLFIAAITVPFDIRDLYQDKSRHLKTIPVIFGEKKAYYFSLTLLVLYILLFFIYPPAIDAKTVALTVSALISGWMILYSRLKRTEYYYFLVLDGMLILQLLLLLLAGYLQS